MNPFDILLIVLLAGVVLLAIRRLYRKRKQGGGCGCGCSGCVNTACSGHNNTQRKGEKP